MKYKQVLLICVGLLLGFHLWSLMRYPPPFVDEAWIASRAWGLLHTGYNFGPLDSGVFDNIEGYWTFFPLFPTLIFSAALRLLPQPELLPLRLVTLIAGAWLLAMVYAIAYRLQGRALALVSLVLCGFSLPFIGSSHLARPDIIASALGFSAICLYLYNAKHNFGVGFLSGLSLGLAFELHPNAALYAPVLGLMYIRETGLTTLRRRDFWGFIVGGLTGGIIYVILHILPYPDGYQFFMRLAFSASHTPPIMSGLKAIGVSIVNTIVLILSFSPSYGLLMIWGMIEAARQGGDSLKRWSVFTGLLCAMFCFLVSLKNFYYAILITPALDILVAYLALRIIRELPATDLSYLIPRVLLWGICIAMGLTKIPLLFNLLLAAWLLLMALWVRQSSQKFVTMVYGLGMGVSSLILYHFLGSHTLMFIPPLDFLWTSLTLKIFRVPPFLSDVNTYVKFVIFSTFLMGNLIFSALLTAYNYNRDYRLTQERINQRIQSGDSIMGAQTYWFGLYEHRYYSWESLVYYQRYKPGTSVTDALQALRPDILIMDKHLRSFVMDDERIFYGSIRIPATPFYDFLEKHAEVIDEFDGGVYGDVVMYRFKW